MATVGGVREVEATANNQEIVNLARFAVDEHNKKQVGTQGWGLFVDDDDFGDQLFC